MFHPAHHQNPMIVDGQMNGPNGMEPSGVHLEIDFPPEKAGLIFGRGGRTLNSVKRETSAKVVVDAERGRILISSANARAAHKAKALIQNILASSESQRLIYFGNLSKLEHKTVCFQLFEDPSLIRPREGKVFILVPGNTGAGSVPPAHFEMLYNPDGLSGSRARERYGGNSAASSRTGSPVASSLRSSADCAIDGHLFVDIDIGYLRARLTESLERLKPAVGQVELLCRFGKMVFSRVPEEVVGVPLTIEALHNVIRTRQILYTFEGGAGIPDQALSTVLSRLRGFQQPASTNRSTTSSASHNEAGNPNLNNNLTSANGVVPDSQKSVYYLSILPDSTHVGLARRKRLDVMLERAPVPEGVETDGSTSLTFCGVREPYMKPFKADLINLGHHVLDMRIAVRASALPIQGEGAMAVEHFASTVKVAGHLELEYPADSRFRVTGCALKTVENLTVPTRGLSIEVIEHEGQASPRRFEFTATTMTMETVLGPAGAGVVRQTPPDWSPVEVLKEFDGLFSRMEQLGDELTAETRCCFD